MIFSYTKLIKKRIRIIGNYIPGNIYWIRNEERRIAILEAIIVVKHKKNRKILFLSLSTNSEGGLEAVSLNGVIGLELHSQHVGTGSERPGQLIAAKDSQSFVDAHVAQSHMLHFHKIVLALILHATHVNCS